MNSHKRTVHKRIQKADDLWIHVSTLTVRTDPEQVFTEIREYVPSLRAYGRGVTFPRRLHDEVYEGLSFPYGNA